MKIARPAPAGGVEQALRAAMAFHRAGDLARAEALYREVLGRAPRNVDALHLLGLVAHSAGRREEAADLIARAIAVNGREPGFHNNLGLVYQDLNRLEEAEACYRRALALNPDFAEANSNYARIMIDLGRYGEAVALCRRALAVRPDFPEAWCNLGLACNFLGRLDEALDACRRAVALRPAMAQGWCNLGNTWIKQGRSDEAVAALERALAIDPGYAGAFDNLLLALLYRADSGPDAILAAHRRYARAFESRLRVVRPELRDGDDPARRLRIGYLSPDFRYHSVAFFIEALLEHHDRDQLEVWCYHDSLRYDAVSARIQAHADHWVPCRALGDDALARRIRADGIDILVDLAGHTANNRLPVFVRRPAPIQVTWLGYPTTTGLDAMDYRLTTADIDPEGSERYHTEQLWRLPRTLWCYRPAPDAPAPPGSPASLQPAATGSVCFGSLNNFPKVSPEALATWIALLRAVPGARLVMTAVPEGTVREHLLARFADAGIDAARVTLHDRLPSAEFHAVLRGIDIALDSFPYAGTTTTCESLWMGIPVVTLIGDTSVARSGYALLRSMGLDELCAHDEADFVRIAAGLAHDPQRLHALSAGLRARMECSPLRDEQAFTRDIEAAYRAMWERLTEPSGEA